MARTGNVKVSILGDARDLQRATREAEGSLHRLDGSARRVTTGFASLAKGAAVLAGPAAIYGVTKALTSSFTAFKESEKVANQTKAVLKSTGEVAGLTAKQVGDLATAISNKAGIDDEAIQSGETLLLTFKNVRNEAGKGNDVFNRATKAAVDLSAAGFGSITSASKQMGKALNDPVAGISALSRSGVTFTEQQKEQIKTLVESGHTLKAQKIILKEVESQVKGSAEAQATASMKLKVTLGNVAESIGKALSPAVEGAARSLNGFFKQMQSGEGAGGRFVQVVKGIGSAVATAFNAAKAVVSNAFNFIAGAIDRNKAKLQSVISAVRGLVGPIKSTLSGIVSAFKSAFGGSGGASKSLNQIIDAVVTVGAAITKFYVAVIKRVLPGIKQEFQGLVRIVRGVVDVIAGIFTGDFSKIWKGLKGIFSGGIKAIGGVLRAATAPFCEAASRIADGVSDVFSGLWKNAKRIFSNGINGVVSFIRGLGGKFVNAGEFIAEKIVNGIKSLPGKIKGIFSGIGGVIADIGHSIADWLNDHTPFGDKIDLPGPLPDFRLPRLAGGGRVPGAYTAADTVPAMLSPQEFVVTGHGERLLESMTFPGVLNWLGTNQMPHFAKGGRVDGLIANAGVKGFGAGYDGSGFGALLKAIVDKGEPDPGKSKRGKEGATDDNRKRGSSKRSGGTSGPFGAMVSAAQSIDARHFPYVYGGGHSSFSGPYDCSGAVSAVLHAGGLLSSPMTSGAFMGYGVPGPGKRVSLYTDPDHIIMRLGSRYFGTSSAYNPGGGAGFFDVNTMAGRGVVRHPKGFGGGGRVGGIINSLKAAKRGDVTKLLGELGDAVKGEGNFNSLLRNQKEVTSDLEFLNRGGLKGKEKFRFTGLRGALSVLQAEAGRRIGKKANYSSLVDGFATNEQKLTDHQILAGVKPGSSGAAIGNVIEQQKQVTLLKHKRRDLVRALKLAKKTGDKKLIRKVREQLKAIDAELLHQKAEVVTAQDEATSAYTGEQDSSKPEFALFSGADADAFDQAEKDLSLASLTASTDDDLSALYREQSLLSKRIPSLRTDPLATADDVRDAVDRLKSVNEQIGNFTGHSQADQDAITEQTAARNAVAARTAKLGGAIGGVLGGADDLALPNITINTLHPGDSTTLDAIARATTQGLSLQGLRVSPRYATGL